MSHVDQLKMSEDPQQRALSANVVPDRKFTTLTKNNDEERKCSYEAVGSNLEIFGGPKDIKEPMLGQ